MKIYDKYAVKSARQERADLALALILIAVVFALAVDLVVRGKGSIYGQLFIWIAHHG